MELLRDLENNNPLWRYMDTSKFLDLLLHKNLVFPRFDRFEDPYEGHANHFSELVKKELAKHFGIDSSHTYGGSIFSDYVNISNFYAYVSCWHHNKNESAGMWKLYCSTPESLVIKTDVGALKESLSSSEEFHLIFSKVSYDSGLEGVKIKNLKDVNVFNSLLMKRESFEHEKEYRILLIDNEDRVEVLENYQKDFEREMNNWYNQIDLELQEIRENVSKIPKDILKEKVRNLQQSQVYIPSNTSLLEVVTKLKKERPVIRTIEIDLSILIKEIVISPYAPGWFVKTIEKLIQDLGYDFKVSQSKLYELE
ncbi:DUF2971 domain-containing protein [Acinetobacter sp. SwsAc5]|uniref:DUF2971 domain-containing protein n=1 Tax=Acinetobacter sp. SwsAc5 TaxID=2749438 RepID=UPI0015BDCDA7|nr:DUF2971 domain-containing protein [Acinetobacter sp. SwsAc5]NWK52179.1 DUF2971 domain-containing protein [Acinetobacter sp. SwsAc5]